MYVYYFFLILGPIYFYIIRLYDTPFIIRFKWISIILINIFFLLPSVSSLIMSFSWILPDNPFLVYALVLIML